MAHHKKKKNRNTTAGCHMCKFRKLPCFRNRGNENFESFSSHRKRSLLDKDISEYTEE